MPMTFDTKRLLITTTLVTAVGLAMALPTAAQDAKKGQDGLHRSEMPDVPRHRRQGQQGESAGRRRRQAVGR